MVPLKTVSSENHISRGNGTFGDFELFSSNGTFAESELKTGRGNGAFVSGQRVIGGGNP